MNTLRNLPNLWRGDHPEDGTISPLVIILASAMFAGLLAIVVDAGGAWTQKTRSHGVALEAGRAGVDQLAEDGAYGKGDLRGVNPGKATAAACDLAAKEDPQSTCTASVGASGEVTVTIESTYNCQLLGLLGRPTIEVSAEATARPAVGGSGDEVNGE